MSLEELFIEAVWLYFNGFEQSSKILMGEIEFRAWASANGF